MVCCWLRQTVLPQMITSQHQHFLCQIGLVRDLFGDVSPSCGVEFMPPESPEKLSGQLLLKGSCLASNVSHPVAMQVHLVCPRKAGVSSELAWGITLLAGMRNSTCSMLLRSGADCLTTMCLCSPSDVTDGDWYSCTRGPRSEADLFGCIRCLGTGDRGLKARLRSTAYMVRGGDMRLQLLTRQVSTERAIPQRTPCRRGLTKHACNPTERGCGLVHMGFDGLRGNCLWQCDVCPGRALSKVRGCCGLT